MSAVGDTLAASAAARPRAADRANIAALVALTVLAIAWQTRWGTVPDTSWLITVCERMLAGEHLYVDIRETNPPFSVWLYLPAVALAHGLGIAPEILVHAETYLAALAGLLFAGWVVRRGAFQEAGWLFVMAPAIYALLVLFPGNAFSQREHIGVALFLPMLVVMAWRMRSGSPSPDKTTAVLAGLSGSVLILVKPYYAAMVLLPALATCWRKRSLRPLFVVEHWVIGVVCVAYLIAVQLIHPEFLSDVYPRLAEAYVSVRNYLPMLKMYGPAALLLGLAAFLFWPNERPAPELAVTALLASLAGAAVLVWQAKAWAYHAYPALACALLALMCLSGLPSTARSGWRARQTTRLVGQAMFAAAALAAFLPLWVTQKPSDEIVAAIAGAVDHPEVVSISTDIATASPLSRMASGDYRSSYPSLWAVRGIEARMRKAVEDPVEATRLKALRDGFIAEAAEEIDRMKPDVVLDSGGELTWAKKAIHANSRMTKALKAYRKVFDDNRTIVLIRDDLLSGSGTVPNGG